MTNGPTQTISRFLPLLARATRFGEVVDESARRDRGSCAEPVDVGGDDFLRARDGVVGQAEPIDADPGRVPLLELVLDEGAGAALVVVNDRHLE